MHYNIFSGMMILILKLKKCKQYFNPFLHMGDYIVHIYIMALFLILTFCLVDLTDSQGYFLPSVTTKRRLSIIKTCTFIVYIYSQ